MYTCSHLNVSESRRHRRTGARWSLLASEMDVIVCRSMNSKSTRVKTCWPGVQWIQRNCTRWWKGLIIPRNKRFCAVAGRGGVSCGLAVFPKGRCWSVLLLTSWVRILWSDGRRKEKKKIFSFSKPILKHWKNKDKLIFQYAVLSCLQAKNAKQQSIVPHTSELVHDVGTPRREI